jgi:hypothetical protein
MPTNVPRAGPDGFEDPNAFFASPDVSRLRPAALSFSALADTSGTTEGSASPDGPMALRHSSADVEDAVNAANEADDRAGMPERA